MRDFSNMDLPRMQTGERGGSKIPKIEQTSYVYAPLPRLAPLGRQSEELQELLLGQLAVALQAADRHADKEDERDAHCHERPVPQRQKVGVAVGHAGWRSVGRRVLRRRRGHGGVLVAGEARRRHDRLRRCLCRGAGH